MNVNLSLLTTSAADLAIAVQLIKTIAERLQRVRMDDARNLTIQIEAIVDRSRQRIEAAAESLEAAARAAAPSYGPSKE